MSRIRRIEVYSSSNWITNKFSRCFSETDEQEVIKWYQVPQSLLSYAWREQEVPQLEPIQLDEQPAILIRSSSPAFTQLFLRLGEAFYMVGGQVALNELLQVATSIPWKK
jgi:hypothetical protein